MAKISLCLFDALLKGMDRRVRELNISRSEYIRRAIFAWNTQALAEQRQRRLIQVSMRVRAGSLRVNTEFGAFEDAPDA